MLLIKNDLKSFKGIQIKYDNILFGVKSKREIYGDQDEYLCKT